MGKENGEWTYEKPTCEPCEIGFYKSDMSDQFKECSPCPDHSSTSATGSNTIEQCICDDGFNGPVGGPCSEISCKTLNPPENGSISDCGNSFGDVCNFNCDNGYIMKKGSAKRECNAQGFWDGSDAVCDACSENTYKADFSSCFPCPKYSHADGIANILTDCECDKGFEGSPGGPCEDIDECILNDGKGPCSDKCGNTIGGYKCSCTIPGQVIKESDPNNCILEECCRNLTQIDAPANGGLVCHWFQGENSQQCDVRCNKGYDFPSENNDYENCGPSTDYDWTFEKREEKIKACVEESFPDIRIEADSKYFTTACEALSEEEKGQVKDEFAKVLNNEGVCERSKMKVCEVKNMAIICGKSTSFMFGGTAFTVDEVNLSFNISAIKFGEKAVECDKICDALHIPENQCDKLCLPVYKRFLLAAVTMSKQQMKKCLKIN